MIRKTTLALLALAQPAFAQQLPGPAQLPQAEERFQRPTPTPRPQPGETPDIPALAPETGGDDVRLYLRDIAFAGMTVYHPEQMRPLYAGMVGREVSLAELRQLAGRVTDRYRQDGYLLSMAVVPEQSLQDGAVTIQIVEGYVEDVNFQGPVDGKLPQKFADRIQGSRPLKAAALERNLLLIGDLPGVNVQTVLRPSQRTFSAADLDVVIQQTPYEGFVSFDNLGSRYLGPYALAAGISLYSRLGHYEQIDLTVAGDPVDSTMFYVQGAITVPIARPGDTLQFSGLYSQSEPDLPDSVFPFQTRSESTEWRLTYFRPFLRSRDRNLSGRLAFIWRDLENRNTDLPDDPFNPAEEHVRILQPRMTYDSVDRHNAVSLFDLTANWGLGVGSASEDGDPRLVRADSDGQFIYVKGAAARLQPVSQKTSVLLRVDFQLSPEALPTTERFGVGGFNMGAGYPPGTITGDSGAAIRLEGRYGEELGGKAITGYQAYLHLDYGWTDDHTFGPDKSNELSTVGLGVRLNLFKTLAFNPEITHQISGEPADCMDCDNETRFLFSLTQRF